MRYLYITEVMQTININTKWVCECVLLQIYWHGKISVGQTLPFCFGSFGEESLSFSGLSGEGPSVKIKKRDHLFIMWNWEPHKVEMERVIDEKI